ncbi:PREDICTED: heterogeneous nuclear ribonucleoprotein K isoform X2 [Habropoda laboriosa]|uniref:heterogeneous nuclear ribonucleoprotein K isoform X2 n=1 Tax=Habropoda laboriosa TaxID=597456 RepID=UPI00083E5B85|nr:PREDICTED: heterogeneous nuclear ribonucleoprotein K isoform X2 [Habropoda laboriosa]
MRDSSKNEIMKREADAGAMTGSGGPTSPHKRYRQGDDELRLLIPSKVAGSIIGKGGQNITKLRSQYKASIIVPDCPGPERVLTISSDLSTVLQVLNEVVPNLEENGSRHGSDEIDVRMLVHQSQAGCIIGKGGLKIKELREKTGARIKIYSHCCPHSTDRLISICGKPNTCIECIRELIATIKTSPLKGVNNPYDPHNFDDYYADDYGGYGTGDGGQGKGGGFGGPGGRRGGGGGGGGGGVGMIPRQDSRSIPDAVNRVFPPRGGLRGGGGGGGGMSGGPPDRGYGGNSRGGGGGSGGYEGGRGGYGGNRGGHPPYAGGNYNGDGWGMQGGAPNGLGGGGSNSGMSGPSMGGNNQGNQGNMGGNKTSTQVTIPKDLAGAIIGKGGARIRKIRSDSGAGITIDEPLANSNDRIITITGLPSQIQMAQYLLQQSVHENADHY